MKSFPFKLWKKKTGGILRYSIIFDYDPGKPKSSGIPVNEKDAKPGQQWGYEAAVAWAYAKLEHETLIEDISFGEFAHNFFTENCSWRKRNERKGKTFNSNYYSAHRGRLVNYLLPRWGSVPLQWITTKAIDEWLMELDSLKLGTPLSPGALDKILQALRKIFGEAKYYGYLIENPAASVEPFDHYVAKREPFSQEEIDKLFPDDYEEAIRIWQSHDWYTFFLMEKVCGLRPGEVAAFQLQDWIPQLHGAVISRALEAGTNKVKGLKTEKKGVVVKPAIFSNELEDALNVYRLQGKKPDDFLFRSLEGNLIRVETSRKHFKLSAARAGIELNGRTQYCLRHTFYTDLLKRLPEKDVQKMAGHKHLRKEYDHRNAEDFLRAAAPLRDIINSA